MQDVWNTPAERSCVEIYTDEDEETFIVSDVIRYMDFNTEYHNEFVNTINDFLMEKGYITQKQLDVIRGIIKADYDLLEFIQGRREINW